MQSNGPPSLPLRMNKRQNKGHIIIFLLLGLSFLSRYKQFKEMVLLQTVFLTVRDEIIITKPRKILTLPLPGGSSRPAKGFSSITSEQNKLETSNVA